MALRSCALALLLAAAPAAGQDALPAPTSTRFDEDWSVLADPAQRTGHWTEPFKYIPLAENGGFYLTTGLELRVRHEGYANNLTPDREPLDDGYLWLRALPYADLHAASARLFVQPIAAYAQGVRPAPGPVDRTRLDLLQAFAEIALVPNGQASLRAGRQMLPLGSERLVGARYGPNVPLAFDGVRLDLARGGQRLALLWARPVKAGPRDYDDRADPARALWGAYATVPAGPGHADLYYLGYRNRAAVFDQGTGRETRHTFGVRVFGTGRDWSWNIEAMGQFGRFGNGDIRAWSLATDVTRAFPEAPLHPHVRLKANVVSGDANPADRDLGTFNALFPKGQYFGELTPIGPYNIINLHAEAGIAPTTGLTLALAASAYWRENTGDGVYDVPGHLLRASDTSQARFIGKQIEVTADWQASAELGVAASLSAFAPGPFLEQGGFSTTIVMAAFETSVRF